MSATQGIFATVMAMLAIAGLAVALLALSRTRARAAAPEDRATGTRADKSRLDVRPPGKGQTGEDEA